MLLLFALSPSELDQAGHQVNELGQKGSQSDSARRSVWALAPSSSLPTSHCFLLDLGVTLQIGRIPVLAQALSSPAAGGPEPLPALNRKHLAHRVRAGGEVPWAPKPSGMGSRERWRGAALPGTHAVGPDVIRRGRDLSHLLFCPHYRSADRVSCEVHLETKDSWTGAHFPSAESTFENCLQNGPADVPEAAPLSDWTRINEKATADMPFTSFNIAGPQLASVGGTLGTRPPHPGPGSAREAASTTAEMGHSLAGTSHPISPLPRPPERSGRVLARKPNVAHTEGGGVKRGRCCRDGGR